MSQPSREWWRDFVNDLLVIPFEFNRWQADQLQKSLDKAIPAILAKHEEMVMEKVRAIVTEESERLDSDRPSPHDVFYRILSRLSNPK